MNEIKPTPAAEERESLHEVLAQGLSDIIERYSVWENSTVTSFFEALPHTPEDFLYDYAKSVIEIISKAAKRRESELMDFLLDTICDFNAKDAKEDTKDAKEDAKEDEEDEEDEESDELPF